MKRICLSIALLAAVLMTAACTSGEAGSSDAAQESEDITIVQTAEAPETADAVSIEATTAPVTEISPETVQAAETADAGEEAWSPDIPQREEMQQGYICAAAYIGFTDPEMTAEECAELLRSSRYADEYPALADMPVENCIVDCGGYELYLVFPTDENASVSVCEWLLTEENDFAGEAGAVYYRSEGGAPVLIRCNVSDIMPNVVVNIVDNSGNVVQWCPSLSLKDGSMSRYGVEEKVYDMTHYIYNETYECYIIEGEPQ